MFDRLRPALALGIVLALAGCSPTPTPTETTASPTAPATMLVTLYFGNTVLNPGPTSCGKVYAVHRSVPASTDVPRATLQALLAGPTQAEAAQGYYWWFSAATAQTLISARVIGETTYVNLTDLRPIIPNASSSCGSAALLSQLETTAQQAGMTPRALFALNGEPRTFWEWLQMGCDASNDNCDTAPFKS